MENRWHARCCRKQWCVLNIHSRSAGRFEWYMGLKAAAVQSLLVLPPETRRNEDPFSIQQETHSKGQDQAFP